MLQGCRRYERIRHSELELPHDASGALRNRAIDSVLPDGGEQLGHEIGRAVVIMAAFDAGVPLRAVQTAVRHADRRTSTIYDRRRHDFDRHAAYVVVAFVAGG